MPELPEVETMKNGLEPAMVNNRLKKISFNTKKLRYELNQKQADALKGLKVISLKRRAKYLVIALEQDFYIVMHAGMSGSFKTEKDNILQKHDHVVFALENGYFVKYNDPRKFGFCLIYKKDEFNKLEFLNKLGLEPFSKKLTALYLQECFKNKKRSIKSLLLDQTIIVGIGNIYAAEILFNAKISPLRQGNLLNLSELKNIITCTQQILKSAIKLGGSSIKDHKNTDGKIGYFQNHLKVYGKKNCPNCNCEQGITKITQNQRTTYYCNLKQK